MPIRTPRRKAMGSVSTTIHGRDSATRRATSPKPALRRTAKSARKRIVRIRRTNVYAAKPRRNGGQISRRTDRETRRIEPIVQREEAEVKARRPRYRRARGSRRRRDPLFYII